VNPRIAAILVQLLSERRLAASHPRGTPCAVALVGMLKITIYDSAQELRLRLEGRLAGLWVAELRGCWQAAASSTDFDATVLDLREVDFVDPGGQVLLAEMHRRGVRLEASCPLIQHMIEEIAGAPECVRVEGRPARRPDDLARPDPPRPDPSRPDPRAL
jgi:hypothetical protein